MAGIFKIKLFCRSAFIALIVLLTAPVSASSEAMLELIKILRDKGNITDSEYELLRNAAVADEDKIEASVSEVRQDVADNIGLSNKSMELAGWASKLRLRGDIRLRYHPQDKDPGGSRSRSRARYRLGVIAQPVDDWEVGAGLASGPSDSRSTNQTFTNYFSTKEINLDYAYAQYKINDKLKIIGGKFNNANYLYTTSDLLWDSDINPEGFSVNYTLNSGEGTTFASTTFANSGIWVLSENKSSSDDPHMIYAQIGQNFESGNLFGALAGTYYTIEDITSLESYGSNGSNSDFNFGGVYTLSGEIGVNEFMDSIIRTSLFMDWVTNSDTETGEDNGYMIGVKASSGPWSIKYSYADLEQNTWPDIFPDADRLDGLTGIKGHEFIFSYKVRNNIVLDIDYYSVRNDLIDEDLNMVQLDVNVKF
ncbi:MAG: putative porin [Gammaproteobacteria bacterium]|nr:putative porin [Gammaproteobacteria bacterium]